MEKTALQKLPDEAFKSSIKIVIVIETNPFYQNTASANRWRTLIEGLAKQNVDIMLLITEGYNNIAEFKQLKFSGSIKNVKYRYLNYIFHNNIWLRRINNYLLLPLIYPYMQKRVQRILKNSNADIIWTSSSLQSFTLAVALRKQHVKAKLFLEMNEFLDISRYNKGRAIHKKQGTDRQYYFESKAFYSYDLMALMTKTLIKHYEKFPGPGPKLLHLPMTVDLERFKGNIEPLNDFKQPYIAFVGVMNDAKDGVNILIKAFAKIHKQFPYYKLYLIGGWNYDTPGHLKLIKEYNLEDKVFWKGEFSRDKIPRIIKNASLLVLPRPDSKQAQGGFPTKLGEYLATGNPICATTVGEIPDYLKDNESVFFAKPGSVDSFAEAMVRALSDPERAKKIGQNGKKIAERYFNKDIQAKKLYQFLKKSIEL